MAGAEIVIALVMGVVMAVFLGVMGMWIWIMITDKGNDKR
jgi:hypothetical protein